MKDQKTVEKFIELRAENKSFDKISKLLNVSKPTLIEWGKKHKAEINKLQSIRFEQILEKYKLTQEDRLNRLAEELNLAWDSFKKKDYDNLSKREIMLIIMRLEHILRKEPAMMSMDKEVEEEAKDIQITVTRKLISDKNINADELE